MLHQLRQAVQEAGTATATNDVLSPTLDPLIHRVANGALLQLDPLPRLVVFGFDDDQKTGSNWLKHRTRLVDAIGTERLYALGNTRTKATAAFR